MASTLYDRAAAPTSVELVSWPGEASRRWQLKALGQPRLLVVARDQPVPRMLDTFEDWVFEGTDPCEINLRAETLVDRVASVRHEDRFPHERPTIEEGDVLRFGGRWVAVSPTELRILQALLENFDHCVTRDALDHCLGAHNGPSALSSLVKRLRHRLEPLGLAVNTVHGRGYALSVGAVEATSASS
jgi:DNA-binding response OmpR family regulator